MFKVNNKEIRAIVSNCNFENIVNFEVDLK